MHVGATMAWADGRRASFECSFDRAPVQHLEVRRSPLRRSLAEARALPGSIRLVADVSS